MSPAKTAAAAPAVTATANTNIALIKYWGKADESLTIPTASSLSLTLDGTRTTTTVSFDGGAVGAGATSEERGGDAVTINGSSPGGAELARVTRFLDLVRAKSGESASATVASSSTVPLAAGLASSAAGFAALAAAGMRLDDRALSRLARRGSGSATRSVFGGLVLWNAGVDDETSYAEPVECALDLAMVVVVLSERHKGISSTRAMRETMRSSPLYPAWVEAGREDLRAALAAVRRRDLPRLGEVVEANALGMHAAMIASRPGIMYWLPRTVEALGTIRAVRDEGLPVWATIDAGPNVKALTSRDSADRVAAALRDRLPGATVSVRHPGAGVHVEEVVP